MVNKTRTGSPRSARQRQSLTDALLAAKVATPEAIDAARALSESTGKRLAAALLQSGAVPELAMAMALSDYLQITFIDLSRYELKPELSRLLPEALSRRYRALLLGTNGDALLLGMADPTDVSALDDIETVVDRRLEPVACVESQLLTATDRVYRRTDEISDHVRALERDVSDARAGVTVAQDVPDEAPVARLLQSLLEDAVQVRASDIHLEPQERALQIRFRIDGVLIPQTEADGRVAAALTQRLKLMAGLDIAERRMPLDGRFSIKVRERDIDVRLSTLPGQRGESVVMRLLDQSATVRGLDAIGLPAAMAARLREVLNSGSGMVLVTGPTGAGKTTTLYAALSEIDRVSQKVITVEDPVEYRLPGIVQVQVNEKIELDFARVLRATLRQDPDVVLVGEMRDSQTVEIGLRAAVTGHMVLSTLHTRDATSALFRLLDMGAPRYMVATSLRTVVAQRLMRLSCVHCAREVSTTPQEKVWLRNWGGEAGETLKVRAGAGCLQCNHTGFRDRTGLYEMFMMDQALVHAATLEDGSEFLRLARASMRGQTLADHAYGLVRDGKTSVAEAMRASLVGED